VEETFQFYAELLVKGSKADKKRVVRKLIQDLNLEKSADTLIGNELTRGISGGEMKRVAIGSSLVSNPSMLQSHLHSLSFFFLFLFRNSHSHSQGVLILDEPTSGLDSNTAHSIVQYLRALTRARRTVICTIHQPSASTFFV
jgi:ABC-type multidrug transport system ATPase subunit